jgi:thymidine phosphorylase
MNQVLGTTAGNALEVMETIAYLRGDGVREPRQHEVTLALSAELLVLGGLASDTVAARTRLQRRWTVAPPPKYLPAWWLRWVARRT